MYAANTAFTRLVNTVVRNLAGVPSIVYGLLGLAVFGAIGHGGAERMIVFPPMLYLLLGGSGPAGGRFGSGRGRRVRWGGPACPPPR